VDYKEIGRAVWLGHMTEDKVWWWAIVDVIEIFDSY